MPVAANLSKLFYDRLGEQIADEFVGWFRAVDLTCRSDLREMNALNFSRFDSKMEQRFAEQNASIERRFAEPTRGLFLSLAAQLALLVGSLARA